ncbi:YfbK domain-containing protein [Primorskyibacter sp. S187A]|uniref:vWA domain-containing protein n=1 Tax=Primorskyibacter sp. S187A TaxID=3415130 RepID=UPI003C7C8C80
MSDDLDDLAKALRAATPAPDAARKADVLARAQENFEKSPVAAQGSADGPRLTSDRPKTGLLRGVFSMLSTLSPKAASHKAALAGSTAVALIAAVLFVPVLDLGALRPGGGPLPQAPVAAKSEAVAVETQGTPVMAEPIIAEDMAVAPAIASDSLSAAPMAAQSRARTGLAQHGGGYLAERPVPLPMPMLEAPVPQADTEAFPEADTNPVKVTAEDPVSTFSIDVDTASYAVIRNMLSRGQLPQPDTVRIEEMVNYFSYDYPAPMGENMFTVSLGAMQTPWNAGTQLVRIGLQGTLPAIEQRPPLNLVFLIDTSGSMNQPNKLPLLKQSLSLMLSELRPQDEVAIVTYAGSAGEVLAPTPAAERDTILAALDRLEAGGSTAGQAGLQQAYATAAAMAAEGEVSRVLLATDGDFNVGLSDPEALEDFIADKRDSGTYLSVLGFGRGNLDDATMQALAQTGNGTAAYIDTLSEAQKVLVDQLTGALFPIADDVKIQVEWNPGTVAEYRLIGYETRALRREDFNNDAVDAGEIGAGHQVTALYEITPVGSEARLTDPLRYAAPAVESGSDELGFFRLRYKAPGAQDSTLIEQPIGAELSADDDLRFAAAIAGFGQLLRDAPYLGVWGWDQAIDLGTSARGEDRFGYRAEALRLMRLGETLDR